MSLARVGVVLVSIVLAVVAIYALFRAIDERSAPPIVIDDAAALFPIAVEVRGAVGAPGVYELPAGTRLHDAVDEAGGFTTRADLSTVNLARRLRDGETVLIVEVPTIATPGESTASDLQEQAGIDLDGQVNINSASMAQLITLPGIGEVTAQRIIDFREQNGPYRSIDDLVLVEGISTRTIETLRDLIVAGP